MKFDLCRVGVPSADRRTHPRRAGRRPRLGPPRRPPPVMTPAQLKEALRMREEGATLGDIAGTLQVGRAKVVRALSAARKVDQLPLPASTNAKDRLDAEMRSPTSGGVYRVMYGGYR